MPKVKVGDTVKYVGQGFKVVNNNLVEDGTNVVSGTVLEVKEESFVVSTDNPAVMLELNDKSYSKDGKQINTWHTAKADKEEEAEPDVKPAKAAKEESPVK